MIATPSISFKLSLSVLKVRTELLAVIRAKIDAGSADWRDFLVNWVFCLGEGHFFAFGRAHIFKESADHSLFNKNVTQKMRETDWNWFGTCHCCGN